MRCELDLDGPEDRVCLTLLNRDGTCPNDANHTPQHRAEYREASRSGFEAGYAEAVARLRDDERYRSWWSSSGTFPTGEIRRHLADYLETIGAHRG